MCAVGENNRVSTNIKIMNTNVSEEYFASYFKMGMSISASFRSCLTSLIPVYFPETLVFACMLLQVRKRKCLIFLQVKFLNGKLEASIFCNDSNNGLADETKYTLLLTFMGPCIVIIFYYVNLNKLQRYRVYFI
jgi:hypothetical protein